MDEKIMNITQETKQLITGKQAWLYRILPHTDSSDGLRLWIDKHRLDNGIQSELEIITGKRVLLEPLDPEIIEVALNRNYPKGQVARSEISLPRLMADKENFFFTLIEQALEQRSSDIHFEAHETFARVRFRIDGSLVDRYTVPKSDYPALINAIKIKSNLDIAEKRLPQDGRVFFNRNMKRLDIRVSIIPTVHGEKIVCRLLNKNSSDIHLEQIGFKHEQLEEYRQGFLRSHGLVLISGPTGSGKTTTLYATLKKLNTKEKNILTIEDPIEYTLDGINQIQLKEGIGLTFPVALRTFLRQDPDIIMVGEIRDPETAQIAIRSALTGHLVLSTIHTNSAWGIISRLIDMGVPEYIISSTLNVAVAQRLVKLLCPNCKSEVVKSDILMEKYFPKRNYTLFTQVGCADCSYTGFKGRQAIFEVIGIDNRLREMIKKREVDLEPSVSVKNFRTLTDQALELCKQGSTSFYEILPILLNT